MCLGLLFGRRREEKWRWKAADGNRGNPGNHGNHVLFCFVFVAGSTVGFSCVKHWPGVKVVCPRASLLSDGSSANAFMFGIKGCENKLEINVFILGFQNPVAMKLLFSRNLWSENCYFPIWRW